MAGTWGGRRANAGRKKRSDASPSRLARARTRRRAQKVEAIVNARQRALQWLRTFEDPLLDDVLASGDIKAKVEVWKTMRLTAYGSPAARVEINVGPSPAEVLREIAEERRRAGAITVPLLPSPLR